MLQWCSCAKMAPTVPCEGVSASYLRVREHWSGTSLDLWRPPWVKFVLAHLCYASCVVHICVNPSHRTETRKEVRVSVCATAVIAPSWFWSALLQVYIPTLFLPVHAPFHPSIPSYRPCTNLPDLIASLVCCCLALGIAACEWLVAFCNSFMSAPAAQGLNRIGSWALKIIWWICAQSQVAGGHTYLVGVPYMFGGMHQDS